MFRLAFHVLFAVFALSGAVANAKTPDVYSVSQQEAQQMLKEADDFIDDMPDALQDRQADAVLHAMRGMVMELKNVREGRNSLAQYPDNINVKDIIGDGAARGLKFRLYLPKIADLKRTPLLVYFHGGGWAFGSLNSCSKFCSALASKGIAVLAADYSLAPEKQAPQAMLDCVAALDFARDNAGKWGLKPENISVGGDSAGGNLAIAAAMYHAKENGSTDAVKSLVLFYPVTKAYADGSGSWKNYSRGYGLDGRLMEAFNLAYLGENNTGSEYESPGDADDASLKMLPPVLLVQAERDILFDQGKEFAGRLTHNGVKNRRVVFPGSVHLFITVDGQPTAFGKAIDVTSSYLTQ